MARVVIFNDGTKRYYNHRNELHREDGPSVIRLSGKKIWHHNGRARQTIDASGWITKWDDTSNEWGCPNGYKYEYNYNGNGIWPELK